MKKVSGKQKKTAPRKPSKGGSIKSKVVQAPVARTSQLRQTGQVSVKSSKVPGEISITHRELIATLAVPGAVSDPTPLNGYTTGLPVQPGINTMFPLASYIGKVFDQYRVSLEFEYVPMCPTSTAGEFMMCLDTDAGDAAPSTEIAIMAMKGAASTPVWAPTKMRLSSRDLHPDGRAKYVRTIAVPSTADKRVFDAGTLWIFTTGVSVSTKIGYLYVKYTLRFNMPQLPTSVASWYSSFVSWAINPSALTNVFDYLPHLDLGSIPAAYAAVKAAYNDIRLIGMTFAFPHRLERNKKGRWELVDEAMTSPGALIIGLTPGQPYRLVVEAVAFNIAGGAVQMPFNSLAPSSVQNAWVSADNSSTGSWTTMASSTAVFVPSTPEVQLTFTNANVWFGGAATPAGVSVNIMPLGGARMNAVPGPGDEVREYLQLLGARRGAPL